MNTKTDNRSLLLPKGWEFYSVNRSYVPMTKRNAPIKLKQRVIKKDER